MKIFYTAILVLILGFSTQSFAGSSKDPSADILEQMFSWWNDIMSSERELTTEDFARYYTNDAVIVLNGIERVRGVAMMPAFFKANRDRTEFIEIVLPFKEKFIAEDKIFTYHTIRAIRNGVEELSHNMGYAIIENGKIASVNLARFTMEP
jgi:hypothetical protein